MMYSLPGRMTWPSYHTVVETFYPAILDRFHLRSRSEDSWRPLLEGEDTLTHVLLKACAKPFGHPFFLGEPSVGAPTVESHNLVQRSLHDVHLSLRGVVHNTTASLERAENAAVYLESIHHDLRSALRYMNVPTPIADMSALQKKIPLKGTQLDWRLDRFLARANLDLLGRYLAANINFNTGQGLRQWLVSIVEQDYFKGRYWPCDYPPAEGRVVNPALSSFFQTFAAQHLYGRFKWYRQDSCQQAMCDTVRMLNGAGFSDLLLDL